MVLAPEEEAAWSYFQEQRATYQKTALSWVISAKKEETRSKRLRTLIEDSASGRTLQQFTPIVKKEKINFVSFLQHFSPHLRCIVISIETSKGAVQNEKSNSQRSTRHRLFINTWFGRRQWQRQCIHQPD
ncbi:YdeI/OmpD-associated family protein [Paenibacillus sp. Leaf72]|uniref:YdeI/OmpD-associated family protein n=1 Tax=Paenibacillus sp. Leaf72 TaxID=1736234 RepID=UPI0009D78935|nr:YdeI/OmpD-associated family protein [Paenibacillus sp. Leaf72]